MIVLASFKMPVVSKYVKRKCERFGMRAEMNTFNTALRIECKNMYQGRNFIKFSDNCILGNEVWIKRKYIETIDIYDWH